MQDESLVALEVACEQESLGFILAMMPKCNPSHMTFLSLHPMHSTQRSFCSRLFSQSEQH